MIELNGITKRYNGNTVLDSVDLSVKQGTVFGFIGPNGAGKTTTIGIIVGHLEPTSGSCRINGIDAIKNPFEVKKHIGYLPDKVGFYRGMTGRQNLQFFMKFHEIDSASANRRIDELLEYVGLGSNHKPVGFYSKGMKQRLGLAHALLIDPSVIILDEPTSGLDPQGTNQFLAIINDLKSKGKTILISSHILSEIRQTCDNIGIISKGKIVATGTEDEVRGTLVKEQCIAIKIRAKTPIPRLHNPAIIDTVQSDGCTVVYARTDIREAIAQELLEARIPVLEFRIDEKSLEDLFVKYVYGS